MDDLAERSDPELGDNATTLGEVGKTLDLGEHLA